MENQSIWGIVYCPKHAAQRRHKFWEKVEHCLIEKKVEYDFVQSENNKSVERLISMLINNGYRTIVVVGGDSALNDAANCLMRVEKHVRDEIVLGLIPNGMMNDFASFWEMEEGDIERQIDWIMKRRVRKIDIGCIRYTDKQNNRKHRYFLNSVNVGFLSDIMHMRRKTLRFFGSRILSFVFSFILLMFKRKEYKMHIKINSDVVKRKVMTVCVGNAHGYGQTPNAVPYNGLLDVSVVYHPEVMQLLEGFYLFISGKFLNHKSVHPYRTREVKFVDMPHAPVNIDGRMLENIHGDYSVEVEQEVINFIMPG
ncbi:MAG: diacylglycerol kinase family protein [Prevotella sp.]|uniref:diacylglycerol/lipid kinase family protein n=1 Tax=Prevotella sp. TaxID=59823 RepID=UPI002A2AFD7D|nr:diacylglycerol kinase family protein [Prevotella sp.]MDD7318086.1 diacylglycerol kinase family protein [Prevotellaceae bacterium]MDY4021025.1 diacylglycerol kinase family protein [Prevotella sp.]